MSGDGPRAFDRASARCISRRNMPHWRQEGAVYFVTFRLADALPEERLAELRELIDIRQNGSADHPHGDQAEWDAINRVDQWLHAGHGSCCLRELHAGEIVESALRFFDAQRYRLGAYVVMPNHVHVLVCPQAGHALSRILHSWKSFSANEVNKALSRTGRLWQDESFDHIVRDDEAFRRFECYIQENAAAVPPGHARTGHGTLTL